MARCPMCRSEMADRKCTQTRRKNCPYIEIIEIIEESAEENEL